MNVRKQLFDKLSYMAPRPNLHDVLELINQLDESDINVKDYRGLNLLHLAVNASLNDNEYYAISLALISKGIEVNTPSAFSPLHYAAINGHTRAIRFLIKHNANVNAKDEYGETPLHYAIRCRCQGAVKATIYQLIVNGADTDVKDTEGKSANKDYNVKTIVKEIENIKASNKANFPSLKLFSARSVALNNLNRDVLNDDCKSILNEYENKGEYKRFIGIGN